MRMDPRHNAANAKMLGCAAKKWLIIRIKPERFVTE